MRRTHRLLTTLAFTVAAVWLAVAAPARSVPTDGAHASWCGPPAGQHASARLALSVATIGGDTEGETIPRPSLLPADADIRTSETVRAVPMWGRADPAGDNRASLQGRVAHPPTAPPARI